MTYLETRDLACKHFGITIDQFVKGGRKKETLNARICVSQTLKEMGYSVEDISNFIGTPMKKASQYLLSFEDKIRFDYDFKIIYDKFIKDIK